MVLQTQRGQGLPERLTLTTRFAVTVAVTPATIGAPVTLPVSGNLSRPSSGPTFPLSESVVVPGAAGPAHPASDTGSMASASDSYASPEPLRTMLASPDLSRQRRQREQR